LKYQDRGKQQYFLHSGTVQGLLTTILGVILNSSLSIKITIKQLFAGTDSLSETPNFTHTKKHEILKLMKDQF